MDYSLLMVSRFREELANGVDVGDAVARTMATAGRTIAFSALAVAAALSAMLVFPVYFLKSFAYAGVGVTLFSAASALLVLPALLAVLGGRVTPDASAGAGRAQRRSAVLGSARRRRDAPAPSWLRCRSSRCCCSSRRRCSQSPSVRRTIACCPRASASHQVGDALRDDFATTPDVIDVLITPAAPQRRAAGLHPAS